MKEVLIVSIGSFFGGGMRYWISKFVQACTVIAFPFGTMAVNVAGLHQLWNPISHAASEEAADAYYQYFFQMCIRDSAFTEFKGAFTEQYVLQQLLAVGLKPYYWRCV